MVKIFTGVCGDRRNLIQHVGDACAAGLLLPMIQAAVFAGVNLLPKHWRFSNSIHLSDHKISAVTSVPRAICESVIAAMMVRASTSLSDGIFPSALGVWSAKIRIRRARSGAARRRLLAPE